MEDMLYGLMLASGNDAAVAIAEHIDGSVAAFCERMTARARELGCEHTVFLTPHGLPQDGHYTTAHDLALIAREAMKNETFRQIVSTTRATIPWEGREYDRILNNKNKLLTTYPGATGIKTGYTRAAGRCLVSSAQRDGMELICVVLNCADWFDESARLLDAAFAEYGWFTMLEAGETVREMQVEVSDGTMLPIVAQGELGGVASKDSLPSLELDTGSACGGGGCGTGRLSPPNPSLFLPLDHLLSRKLSFHGLIFSKHSCVFLRFLVCLHGCGKGCAGGSCNRKGGEASAKGS